MPGTKVQVPEAGTRESGDPLLSIIIVSWNTREMLSRCLEAVRRELAASGDHAVDVWVVDNGSEDGSAAMVRGAYPFAMVIENNENRGFAAANNQGIRASSGRFVLLLNSDAELHGGALRQLIGFMRARVDAGACGARLLNRDGSLQDGCHPMLTPEREFWRLSFLDRVRPKATYPMARWDTSTAREVEVVKGACLMLRREALDDVGLLDERYHMYTEEVDLCYRLAKAGWSLWYVPTAVVTHYGGASSEQVHDKMYVQLYRSKVQFYRKSGGDWRARRFKLLTGLAYAPRAALRPRQAVYRRLLRELPGL